MPSGLGHDRVRVMDRQKSRRTVLKIIGVATATAFSARPVAAAPGDAPTEAARDYMRPSAVRLRQLSQQLAAIPRRRGFKTLPMVLTQLDQWDSAALDALLAYAGSKQLFDTTRIAGGWINSIRNTVNARVWSFEQADFLAAATPHGSTALALFTQAAWTKYRLAEQTDGAFKTNTFLADPDFPQSAVNDPRNATGLYSEAGNFVLTLQKRGVVFLGCHNAIWELAGSLIAGGINPDGATHEQLAADLTNSLIPGVIATPGNEATIGVLQHGGFVYSYV
jgi:hypothetical protein